MNTKSTVTRKPGGRGGRLVFFGYPLRCLSLLIGILLKIYWRKFQFIRCAQNTQPPTNPIPWGRAPLEKLTFSQLFKKFTVLYMTGMFINVNTHASPTHELLYNWYIIYLIQLLQVFTSSSSSSSSSCSWRVRSVILFLNLLTPSGFLTYRQV